MDLSQENSKKSEKIPKKSEKNSGNPQDTSYGDILDPTLHALALALPLCPVREETLLEAIYLENWNDFTLDGLLPAQRLAYNLLFEILTPYHPGHLRQLPPQCSTCGPGSLVWTQKFHPQSNPTKAMYKCHSCMCMLTTRKLDGVKSCEHPMWEVEWGTYVTWIKETA